MPRWLSKWRKGRPALVVGGLVVVAVTAAGALLAAGPCANLMLDSAGVDPDELVREWERRSNCDVRTAESGSGFSGSMSIYEVCVDSETGEIKRNGLEMLVWEDFDPVWRRVSEQAELRERREDCAGSPQAP